MSSTPLLFVAVAVIASLLWAIYTHQSRLPVVFRPKVPMTRDLGLLIAAAEVEARQWGHAYIGPEHLLLSLTAPSTTCGSAVLQSVGADPLTVRERLSRLLSSGQAISTTEPLRYTSRSWLALKSAEQFAIESRSLNVDCRHLLFGLAEEQRSMAAQILDACGVTAETLRRMAP